MGIFTLLAPPPLNHTLAPFWDATLVIQEHIFNKYISICLYNLEKRNRYLICISNTLKEYLKRMYQLLLKYPLIWILVHADSNSIAKFFDTKAFLGWKDYTNVAIVTSKQVVHNYIQGWALLCVIHDVHVQCIFIKKLPIFCAKSTWLVTSDLQVERDTIIPINSHWTGRISWVYCIWTGIFWGTVYEI